MDAANDSQNVRLGTARRKDTVEPLILVALNFSVYVQWIIVLAPVFLAFLLAELHRNKNNDTSQNKDIRARHFAYSAAHSHRVYKTVAYRKVSPTGAEFGDSDSLYTKMSI